MRPEEESGLGDQTQTTSHAIPDHPGDQPTAAVDDHTSPKDQGQYRYGIDGFDYDDEKGLPDPFIEKVRKGGLLPPKPQSVRRKPPRGPLTVTDDKRWAAYASGAMQSVLAKIGETGPETHNRNQTLYQGAADLRRFTRHGHLQEDAVTYILQTAAYATGLVEPEVTKSIRSGYRKDDESDTPCELPEGYEVPEAYQMDGIADFDPAEDSEQAAGSGKRKGLRIDTVRGSEVESRTAEFSWRHGKTGCIQRGTLSLFGGRPGVGKSTAAREISAQWTRGTLGGCWYGLPQRVAYIGVEESLEYTVVPGLRAAGADMSRVFFPVLRDDEGRPIRLMSARDEELLGDWLIDNGITVVVVDPLMSTISGKADVNRNNEVRSFVEPWARIAQRIDGVVIGVAHLNKAVTGDVVAGINGSSAFGEVARSVFGFVKDPDSEDGLRIMSQAKNSNGPEDLSLAYRIETVTVTNDDMGRSDVAKFVLVGDSDRSVSDVLRGGLDRADDGAVVWLRDYLTLNGRTPSKDVKRDGYKDAGHSESAMKRAANKLRVTSERVGFPATTFWDLPQSDRSQAADPQSGPTGPTEPTGGCQSNNNTGQGTDSQSDQLDQPTGVGPTGGPTVSPKVAWSQP